METEKFNNFFKLHCSLGLLEDLLIPKVILLPTPTPSSAVTQTVAELAPAAVT